MEMISILASLLIWMNKFKNKQFKHMSQLIKFFKVLKTFHAYIHNTLLPLSLALENNSRNIKVIT